jgi:hypothetical protein
MKIKQNNDHYLLSNTYGSYHISVEAYNKLGKDKAIELATEEIKKKSKVKYHNDTINFDQARELGFCEYGIKDFASKLDLNINNTYKISYLKRKITLEILLEYPNECLTLFGKGIIDKFGGVLKLLKNNEDSKLFYFIVDNYVKDDILHKFSVIAAYYSLKNFENVYPNDNRPRLAIEVKEKWIKGEISKEELSAAESAARSAAELAAWSAARLAARLTAWSAAELAAKSAARSAARLTAWSAVESAELAARLAARLAAESAAELAARSAELAAKSAAYKHFSEELYKLIKES